MEDNLEEVLQSSTHEEAYLSIPFVITKDLCFLWYRPIAQNCKVQVPTLMGELVGMVHEHLMT